jgi:hypothetical protein
MKKAIWVLNINNYKPEITKYTLPTIKAYAERIGAEYSEITERKFPSYPVTYEKIQIHELGSKFDWNILIDADLLISKNFPDVTNVVNIDTVGIDSQYDIRALVKESDIYFARDGRLLGIAGYFVVTSFLTHDLWEPLESVQEGLLKIGREFSIDEYCISRNLAKYGLKVNGICLDRNHLLHLSLTTDNTQEAEKIILGWLEKENK